MIPLILFSVIGVQESFEINDHKIPSPRVQLENGISAERIECNEGLILISSYDYESLENTPYCVKPETAKKLDERDWIKYHPSSSLPGRYDVHVASIQITDVSGNSIPYANLNQETLIISDLTYSKYKDQPLVYYVEINNPDGTIDLHQIEDTLKMGQSLSPSISWIPNQIGIHEIELFFWESTDPLITIGSPSFHTIEVKDTELKNKSDKMIDCNDVGGTWLDEHNECESTGMTEAFENYCNDFNGEYDSCASGCRNNPAEPDQVCTAQCFAVCEFD